MKSTSGLCFWRTKGYDTYPPAHQLLSRGQPHKWCLWCLCERMLPGSPGPGVGNRRRGRLSAVLQGYLGGAGLTLCRAGCYTEGGLRQGQDALKWQWRGYRTPWKGSRGQGLRWKGHMKAWFIQHP